MPRLGLRLTPHGHLVAEIADDAPEVGAPVAARIGAAFDQGSGVGLLRLGAGEVGQALPPAFVWWRTFATRYVTTLCLHASGARENGPDSTSLPDIPEPGEGELATLVLTGPMCQMTQSCPGN